MKMMKYFFGSLLSVLLLASCGNSPYYQKSYSMPSNKWATDFKPKFVIDIEDTSVYYNSSIVLRHTNLYAFSNLWLNVLVKSPGDTNFVKTRIEIPLATPQGKWLGVGMGEIYEQRRMMVLNHDEVPITNDLISVSEESLKDLFHRNGRYEIVLEQNMREPKLPNLLHIGLRVEKSSKRNAPKPNKP